MIKKDEGLDKKYKNNPSKILNVHEGTREDGHGLGMWMVNNTVYKLNGNINIDGEKDVHLEKVREYIEIYPENIFSIDEMADSAFSSKYNFIRRFKERTGLTPHQFQIQNRIRKAQKLLEKLSITTEVALTTGFYDQSHFIRNFKKIVKMTPLEFQSSIKRINLFKEELE